MTIARNVSALLRQLHVFQDCNHGSALLGFLQIGAAQGLTHHA